MNGNEGARPGPDRRAEGAHPPPERRTADWAGPGDDAGWGGPDNEIQPAQAPLPSYQPPVPAPGPEADPELRAAARKQLAEQKDFRLHLGIYGIIMTLLVMIWLITGGWNNHFWPIWPMMGWGVAVAIHALTLRSEAEPSEEEIAKEARRIAERSGRRPRSTDTPED